MRIIVPIKQVPETSNVKMDPETGTMIREGVEAIVNPLDLYAIESALLLREKLDGEVIGLSMGPPNAEKALREALAMGCDDAVLLSDRQFAGSDTWATAYALAEAIKRLGDFDLVICGERATDGDTGQVGPGIAAFLDLPLATYVRALSLHDDGLRAHRLIEDGEQTVWTPLPAVVTVIKEIAYPRLPTLHGKRRAKRAAIPVWTPEEIEANTAWLGRSGSPTRVVKIDKPQIARQGERLVARDGEGVAEAANRVIAYLKANHLLS